FAQLCASPPGWLETLSACAKPSLPSRRESVPEAQLPGPYVPDRASAFARGNQARETDRPEHKARRSRFSRLWNARVAENQTRALAPQVREAVTTTQRRRASA